MTDRESLFECRYCEGKVAACDTDGLGVMCDDCKAHAASLVPLNWTFPYPVSGAAWE